MHCLFLLDITATTIANDELYMGEDTMIDIEAILGSQSDQNLKDLKLFLFKENIRLENEKKEIMEAKDKLIRERAQFRTEMDMLNHRIVLEQKRLKDDTLFFDKKMQILKDGYKNLDYDRIQLEKERYRFELDRELWERENTVTTDDTVSVLFRRTSNPLALRKRYKDLMKIFHPDNLFGDAELVQRINKEYEKRKKVE